MSSFALGPLSNRAPEYQNQYTLVNEDGWLRLAAISRRILALPTEILADIFFFCLPFHDDVFIVPDLNDAPLVLCAVCQRWRNIALTTPQLWSSISFNTDHLLTSQSGALYVQFCRLWLDRARSAPLSIYWDYLGEIEGDPPHSLLEIVRGLSLQWRAIELGRSIPPSIIPVDGNYPLLEKLYLFMDLSHHATLSFLDAPRLRTVLISEYMTGIRLPWPQLISFRTDCIGYQPCLDLFRHASNLVDAYFRIPVDISPSLPKAVFTLPKLRSLNLGGTYRGEGDYDEVVHTMPMALLNCLKAPTLEILTLGFDECSSCDISPFLYFVSQSAFQLHTLTLSLIPTTAEDLIECLTASPTVIDLKLQISSHILDLNPVFAEFTGHREFLPKLESLHIALRGLPTVDASLVASVLGWRAGVGLRFFRFAVFSHSQLEDFFKSVKSHPACSELEASGMHVYLGKRTLEDLKICS